MRFIRAYIPHRRGEIDMSAWRGVDCLLMSKAFADAS